MTSNHNDDNANIRRYVEIDGEKIPVTEEVYRAYKRPLWTEHKRQEREKRCRDENGFRCTKDCRTCTKSRDGGDLSLDKLSDDGLDIPDSGDITELVADKLILEQLVAVLDDLEPDERSLIDAIFFQNRTEREYAAEIGISHQAVGKRKNKVIEKLRELMNLHKK